MDAFTTKYPGNVGALITDCGVGEPFLSTQQRINAPHKILQVKALWDTGARNSVIDVNVAKALNLAQTGLVNVHHANGVAQVPTYLVNIVLPNHVAFPSVSVSEGKLTPNFQVLIGMDIISRGDFAISSKEGNTIFSFQLPSTHEIDFVAEGVKKNEIQKYAMIHNTWKKSGNEKCPCGSGKLWKNCHGKSEKG